VRQRVEHEERRDRHGHDEHDDTQRPGPLTALGLPVMVALVPEPELLAFKLDPGQLALLPPPHGRRRWRYRIGVRQVGEQSGQVSHRLRPHGPVKPVAELGLVEPSVTEVLSQAIGDRSPFGVADPHV
jgi:hypothetical protein